MPNHGDHGDHGDKSGKGFMEERFSMSYNQAYPRVPRGSPWFLLINPRLEFTYAPSEAARSRGRSGRRRTESIRRHWSYRASFEKRLFRESRAPARLSHLV